MKTPQLLLIGGKPYSGKSTITNNFVTAPHNFTVGHLSMGERMRAIAKGEIRSKYAVLLQQNLSELQNHTPVPTEMPILIFEEYIRTAEVDLVILDAFPRYPDRITPFKESVSKLKTPVIAICEVVVSDDTVFKRSQSRAQRYENIIEDRNFIKHRLHDFETSARNVIDTLRNDYPYYILNGELPTAANLTELDKICQQFLSV